MAQTKGYRQPCPQTFQGPDGYAIGTSTPHHFINYPLRGKKAKGDMKFWSSITVADIFWGNY
jgi:hypothetical protein